MKVICHPARLRGEIAAIPSKSDAHRALICAALSDRPTRVHMRRWQGEDIEATIRCLTALGAVISYENSAYTVAPIDKPPEMARLDCGESGSTLRFLIPVAAALGGGAVFTGAGRLPQRPVGALLNALRTGGITTEGDGLPLRIQGKLQSREYRLPGDISSQFITGLLLALPILPGGGAVALSAPLESSGYLDMTLDMLRRSSVEVRASGARFEVPAGRGYLSPGEVTVEGDWSNMAFFLAAGALSGGVECTGLSGEGRQGDKAVHELLARFGAAMSQAGDRFSVMPGALTGAGTIDAREIPDLVPILAVVAAFSPGETRFINAGRLRFKESDRIESTARMVRALGGAAREDPDALIIQGRTALSGGQVDCAGDHRIAMAAAIGAAACEGSTALCGAEAVNKSYPTFFEDYKMLGGNAHVVDDR